MENRERDRASRNVLKCVVLIALSYIFFVGSYPPIFGRRVDSEKGLANSPSPRFFHGGKGATFARFRSFEVRRCAGNGIHQCRAHTPLPSKNRGALRKLLSTTTMLVRTPFLSSGNPLCTVVGGSLRCGGESKQKREAAQDTRTELGKWPVGLGHDSPSVMFCGCWA